MFEADGPRQSDARDIRPGGIADSEDEEMFRTRAAHAGERTPRQPAVRPLCAPIVQSAAYAFDDADLADRAFVSGEALYARDGLPNARALERAVADLEGAEAAIAVSSGMAAISLALFGTLGQGDHVVASRECYCDTRTLLTENFARFGVTASFVDPADIRSWRDAVTPRTRLVLAETISNPGMELADLPALSAVAHDAGAVLLVDNTFATPALCRPLEHGADLVAHSAGKLLGGHHDVTSGVLLGTRRLLDPIRRVAYLTGPVLAPMEAWLTLRGIKTLAPRMAWVSQTAVAVARFLRGHPAVGVVRYPGDPDGARAALTRRLLPGGAGGLMTFDLTGGCGAADDFFKGLRMIPYAATVGGTSTIVSYPPRAVAGDAQRNGDLRTHRCATVRVSIGLEDPADIVADLRRALDRAGVPAAAGRGAAGGAAS